MNPKQFREENIGGGILQNTTNHWWAFEDADSQ
jgi:hypothetical protein